MRKNENDTVCLPTYSPGKMGIPQFGLPQAVHVLEAFAHDVRFDKNRENDAKAVALYVDVLKQRLDEICRKERFRELSWWLPNDFRKWDGLVFALIANNSGAMSPLPEIQVLRRAMTVTGYISFLQSVRDLLPSDMPHLIRGLNERIAVAEAFGRGLLNLL